jgi:hypothetical protein
VFLIYKRKISISLPSPPLQNPTHKQSLKSSDKGNKINISIDCISIIWKAREKGGNMMWKEEKNYIS